jgi:hypothetical protein
MATLFIDIQTIPSQNPALIAQLKQSIKPPANYTQAESIAKWYRENLKAEAEKKYRQTALDGLHGEIFSIAWAIDEGEVIAFWRDAQASERGLLQNFMAELADLDDGCGGPLRISKWVGHYISGFDLRFIWQRCVINAVKPTVNIPIDAKPWDDRVFDTKIVWTGAGPGYGQGGLDAIAQAFGLNGKAGDGGQVYDDWLAGDYDAIAAYNRQSVTNARKLYRRMNFMDVVEQAA